MDPFQLRQPPPLQDRQAKLRWYQAGHLAAAAACFAAALAHYPDDGPARLYATQAAYFTVHGIPPGWMGVDVLDAK